MIFDPNRITDDFGRSIYYSVGNFKTTSKILALEQAQGNISQISFHWNEHELDTIAWDTRPTQTIEELMDQEVLRIRANHSHVSLFYSAGYDSHTIYDAFRRNNVKIDRFIIWRREWYAGHSDIEYFSAIESSQWIKQNVWPDLEVVTVPWRIQDTYDWYRSLKNDWIYHNGSVLKFSKSSRDLIYSLNDDVKNVVLGKNNSIVICGYEKPKLDLYDGNWYVSHLDTQFFTDFHCPCYHFYYKPEIYHQQAWMLAEWMESLPGFDHAMLHRIQGLQAGPQMYHDYSRALGRTPVFHQYNAIGQGKSMWVADDPKNVIESREFLHQTDIHDKDVSDYYNNGIDYVKERFGHLLNGSNLPGLFSKKYKLKPFTPKTP